MLDALTALRFFAALGVVFHHLGYGEKLGPIAVTFFFVLSGFILTYSYLPAFSRLELRSFTEYACARLARIYPVHALTFLVAIPVSLRTGGNSIAETLANLLLVQSFFPSGRSVFSYNAVSWALSVELFFYLLLPLALAFAARARLALHRKLLIGGAMLLYGSAVAVAFGLRGSMVDYSFTWWLVYISPYFRAVDFLVGCTLGLLFVASASPGRAPEAAGRLLFTFLEIAAVAAVFLSYVLDVFKYDTLSMGLYYVPSFSALIVVFARQRGLLSGLLAGRGFVHLGELSFSIYMIHQLVMIYAAGFVAPVVTRHPDFRTALLQTAVVAGTILISHLLYRYYECPLRKIIRNRVLAAVLP